MSELKVSGTLSKILPIVTGMKKDGSGQWKKIDFLVTNNDGYEGREMLYCFQIFGEKKVDDFIKYNQEGATVDVKFNIQVNEYGGKYHTNLSAYRVESGEKVEQATYTPPQPAAQQKPSNVDDIGEDDLPF